MVLVVAACSNWPMAAQLLKPVVPHSEECYTPPDKMPEFPGGDSAYIRFMCSNVHYPDSAWKHGVQGKVILQFVVLKSGYVGEVKVLNSVSPECDAEAVRVIKMLPRFKPGLYHDKPINVWFTAPIVFQIPKEEGKPEEPEEGQ